jgi:O-antigen/teichoic acid export membrane protein
LPAARALYPTYSRLSGDLTELKKAFLMTLGAVAAICWSAGPGVALVSHDFVAVLLGSQWLSVIPIVPWLALSGALFALSNTVLTVHQATGRARTFALQAWMRVVIMAPLVIYAAQSGDLERLAQAQFLASAVFTPIIFASLRSIIGLTMMDVIRANIRPAISAGMMWIVVPPAIEALSFLPPVARLFVSVAIGGAVFVATMLVLWYIAGRPMGVESSTLATLSKVWRRVRATP